MSGLTNFPSSLDDDVSLYDVANNTTTVEAAHHNNMKEAVKAIEAKIGVLNTTSPTSLDYRLGSPTASHNHDGASGYGVKLDPTTIMVPSGGHPSGLSLYDHLMSVSLHTATAIAGTGMASALGNNVLYVPPLLATGVATALSGNVISVPSQAVLAGTGIASMVNATTVFVPTQIPRHLAQWQYQGSLMASARFGVPLSFGRTMQVENIQAWLRVGPSGATTALDVHLGPTSLWEASQGNRPIFPAGATSYAHASPNFVTYPSGTLLTVDVDAVGSNDPGQDVSITFVFRE